MSSTIIRDWAQMLVQQVVPEAPFQKTIVSLEQTKNLPEIWSTLEFGDANTQRLTLGKPALWREYGSFNAVLLGRSGFGVDPLLNIGRKLYNFATDLRVKLVEPDTGIVGTLRIDNVSPPNADPFEDGNWASVTVICTYSYDSNR